MNKYILAAAAALAMTSTALAADSTGANNLFSIEPDEIALNQNHIGTVNVYLDNETTNFNTFMMDIYLPDGFSIEKNSRGKMVFTVNNDDKCYSHTITSVERGDNCYRILGCSTANEFIDPGKGLLFSFNVIAPEDFDGDAWIDIKNIQIASGSKVNDAKTHYMDDIYCTVAQHTLPTGIDDLEEERSSADTFYDLHGRIVNGNPSKGIYINNGEKILIK